MDTDKVILIVMDEAENFNMSDTQLRIGKTQWKTVIQVSNRSEFDRVYEELDPDQDFIFACHLFHTKGDTGMPLRGYYRLKDSKIETDYPITAHFVSSGDSNEVSNALWTAEKVSRSVSIYSSLRKDVMTGDVKTNKKREVATETSSSLADNKSSIEHVDFGIITALYTNEFDMIEDLFNWTGTHNTGKKVYKIGHPKSDSSKKIVAIHLTETGVVDASVIATQMAEIFKPKIILMPGVCGGDVSTNVGDVIVAKKVFMFQKGKVSDIKDEKGEIIKLYDSLKKEIDPSNLQDENGKKVALNIEKFEIEHNSICELHPVLKDVLEPKLESIKDQINKELKPFGKEINIHLEPMACSTMVINKTGYFEQNVKAVDRKVIALEMESYGIARACEFANEGKTRFLIFKSVMDNMMNKVDGNNKSFAGKTSALFMKYLLQENIL
ncbi:phosphorylase family protein [Sphingobacterium multivorum]|uniref:phosphorylase family protein n=2 Tax=Sphingobacterium multivorum TaxID=28454 RepID=UPI001919B0A3|nr:hypothetical protein [Sphingobacterium multivorum]QQT46109.1 hypothetical protein I6J00_05420 [Sphingobacterium multivorum]